jgi:choline dehydrogenase-like flavoprotein
MMGVAGLPAIPRIRPARRCRCRRSRSGRSARRSRAASTGSAGTGGRADSAIATREHGGRAPCINLGPCISGCAQGAKASTDVTYWPAAIRAGVQLRTHCRVREITVRPMAWPTASSTTTRMASSIGSGAEIVVVACNGVGTPRLLLNSRSAAFPDGLANRSGLVGRNLMFHPYGMVTGVFDERLDGYKGPTGCCMMSQQFYETDPARDFVRGYSFELVRGMGPMSTALWAMGVGRLPWAQGHHAAYRSDLRTAPPASSRSARTCPSRTIA